MLKLYSQWSGPIIDVHIDKPIFKPISTSAKAGNNVESAEVDGKQVAKSYRMQLITFIYREDPRKISDNYTPLW